MLWSLDVDGLEWHELARARASDTSWTASLREAAARALHPRPELVDIVQRGREVSEALIGAIQSRLNAETPEVQAAALLSMYDQVAGMLSAVLDRGPGAVSASGSIANF